MFPQTGIYLGISSPLCLWDSSRTSWLSECCKENIPLSVLTLRTYELKRQLAVLWFLTLKVLLIVPLLRH